MQTNRVDGGPSSDGGVVMNEHNWRRMFETTVAAMAKAKPIMYRSSPTADYDEFCNALDAARIYLRDSIRNGVQE